MSHGKWYRGRFLDIKWLELAKKQDYFPKKEDPDNFKKQLRLAVAVGLKVSKSAVKRNRLKRQIREVLRLMLKDNVLKTGYYVLVVARKETLDKNYAEITEELKLLMGKINIFYSNANSSS